MWRGERLHSPWSSLGGANFAYVIRISSKCGVDLKRLLECFWEAWKEEVSTHGNIVVRLRMKGDDYAIFLITREGEIVAQVGFNEKALERIRSLSDSDLRLLREAWR